MSTLPLRLRWPATVPAEIKGRARGFVWIVLCAYLGLALLYNFGIPRDGAPDESAHYAYVQFLAERHALPALPSANETRDPQSGAIAVHPPLYYSIAVVPYFLLRNLGYEACQHGLRFGATLLGWVTLSLLLRILVAAVPGRRALWCTAFAIAALNPHFLLLSSAMNNDGLLITLTTLLVWLLIRALRHPPGWAGWAGIGAVWGLMLLTKGSALAFAPFLGGLGIWIIYQQKQRSLLSAAGPLLACGAVAVGIGGWWYLRFKVTLGKFVPVPYLPGYDSILLRSPLELLTHPSSGYLVQRFIAGVMRSVWGQVDWFLSPPQHRAMAIYGPPFWAMIWGETHDIQPGLFALTLGLYRFAVCWVLLAALGLVLAVRRRRWTMELSWLALLFCLFYVALGYYTLFTQPGFYEGGRYLLPVISAWATLFGFGLVELFPVRYGSVVAVTVASFFVVWNLACAYNLIFILRYVYG